MYGLYSKTISNPASILAPITIFLDKVQTLLKTRKNLQLVKGIEKSVSVKCETWEGHAVDRGNAELLTAVAAEWPLTFDGVHYKSEFMWTVALNALCQIVRELMVLSVKDLTCEEVSNFRKQIADAESMLCFKLEWMYLHLYIFKVRSSSSLVQHLIDNIRHKVLLSEKVDSLRSELGVLEAELESLKMDEEVKTYRDKLKSQLFDFDGFINSLEKFVARGLLPSYKV